MTSELLDGSIAIPLTARAGAPDTGMFTQLAPAPLFAFVLRQTVPSFAPIQIVLLSRLTILIAASVGLKVFMKVKLAPLSVLRSS